jgi:hypothetical protein
MCNKYNSSTIPTCPISYHNVVHRNHNHLSNNSSYYCDKSNDFTIFYQNMWGISHKIDKLLISLIPNAPQVLCLTEHHLRTNEIRLVNLGQYTLGAHFCRQTHKQGGVCIYISSNIQFNIINLDQYNKEKDLEICAVKKRLPSISTTVICIYRAPNGNFNYFLNQLESILNKIYTVSTTLIFCGDFNINHLNDNSWKHLLESLLASFSLFKLFKQLQILTLPSQYMLPLLVFVAKNRHLFLSNSDIHDKNKCHNCNLHLPTTNLTLVQKGVLYSRSRIYNHLPTHIKTLSNDLKHFKFKLKSFFIEHTFIA